jgi:hypothetical protein
MFVARAGRALGLVDREAQPLDGERILRPDVDVALLAPIA